MVSIFVSVFGVSFAIDYPPIQKTYSDTCVTIFSIIIEESIEFSKHKKINEINLYNSYKKHLKNNIYDDIMKLQNKK